MSTTAGYRLLMFFTRNPELSPSEFRSYYEANHAPLIMELANSAPGLLRYTRRYIDHESSLESTGNPFVMFDAGVPPFDFDVVSDVVFEGRQQAETFARTMYNLEDSVKEKILKDENKLFVRSKMRGMVVKEEIITERSTSLLDITVA
ncbi:MAG: hypothetical protein M1820_006026 [Bogoriella megaspora]|nr:MAG: hypothetical protein M1820_006026 [Bogoriella megaspora]